MGNKKLHLQSLIKGTPQGHCPMGIPVNSGAEEMSSDENIIDDTVKFVVIKMLDLPQLPREVTVMMKNVKEINTKP